MRPDAAHATTGFVTTVQGDSAALAANGDFIRDWEAVRADASLQFTPLPKPPESEPPAWLQRFFEWLGEVFAPVAQLLGVSLPVLGWVALGAIVVLVLWLVAQHLPAVRLSRARAPEPAWTPDRAAALDLLAEAERLAAEGLYGEAAHLLLQRSVEQIAEARPDLLRPSSTAREIASFAALPDAAREAFGAIAARVERSLFALRPLGESDWQAAREAYARFALGPEGVPA